MRFHVEHPSEQMPLYDGGLGADNVSGIARFAITNRSSSRQYRSNAVVPVLEQVETLDPRLRHNHSIAT